MQNAACRRRHRRSGARGGGVLRNPHGIPPPSWPTIPTRTSSPISTPRSGSAGWSTASSGTPSATPGAVHVDCREPSDIHSTVPSPGGPARFHAQQEPGRAESPDCQIVQGECRGEGYGYQRRVLGENGGVPADNEPRGSHDHWLMQQVERQYGFVAVPGGTPPVGLGHAAGGVSFRRCRWRRLVAMDPANPMMATIHAQPASPCRALQPGGTRALRPVPDRLRAPAHDTSGPVAAQATARPASASAAARSPTGGHRRSGTRTRTGTHTPRVPSLRC